MSTLAEIADKNVDCGDVAADTGLLGCQIEFGTPLHALGVRKGFIIPKATVFDKVYIDTQVQIGNFTPMISADSFEETSSEDSMNTNSRGVDRLSVLGLPKYNFTYQQGHEFYKQIAKLTSFKKLDFIFGDDEGNWKLAVNNEGDFTGFSAGQVLAKMTKTKIQGGDPESKTVVIQMLNREQWDKNYAILGRSLLDFSPEELGGANPVEIKVAPLTAAGTSLSFTAVLASDRNTPVSGLTAADFMIMSNGVKIVPTSIIEGNDGEYVAVIPVQAAGKKIEVMTFDSNTNTVRILSEGVIYSGVSNIVTVTI